MSLSPGLPFNRGTTFMGGSTSIISSTVEANYLGKSFRLLDTVHAPGSIAMGTGMNAEVTVVAVKNTSGGALSHQFETTTPASASRGTLLLWDDATAGNFARCCDAKAAGVDTEPLAGFIDDQYKTTIASNDIFYIVTNGPVHVVQGAAGTPIIGGWAINSTTNTGKVDYSTTAATIAVRMVGRFERVATGAADAVHRLLANLNYAHGVC